MNLNFIQDNDQVHVQTQNQFAYKQQIILKSKLLKQDYSDYKQINPTLLQMNALFTQIVNDLYQHVTNVKTRQSTPIMSQREITVASNNCIEILQKKKKKKVPIPYCMMKKLQHLRQKFIHCQKIIQQQNNYYRRFNINSENQKKSQVKFYKQVLTSYQNQRQYYKKQTLKLQDKVQQVETQVKKVSYNQNNPFTDFQSKTISIQSIKKYQKKLAAFKRVVNQMKLLKQAREKIVGEINIENKELLKSNSDQNDNKHNKNKGRQKVAYAKNYLKSIVQTQKKINLLKITKNQLLQSQLITLYNQVDKLKVVNQRLKKAILQSQSENFFLQLEQNLLVSNTQPLVSNTQPLISNPQPLVSNTQPLVSNTQPKRTKTQKVTKTDYIIYLKQLNTKVKEYFKNKQIVYRYKLLKENNEKGSLSRSKSLILSK